VSVESEDNQTVGLDERTCASMPSKPARGDAVTEGVGVTRPAVEGIVNNPARALRVLAVGTGPLEGLPQARLGNVLGAAESSLVIAARAEVRVGRCGEALERLREGSDRFRGRALEQERQALWVSALGCAGRAEEAAAAAAAFVESYPESPYAATVRPYLAVRSHGR
jgi:hypothetical protein